MIMPDSTATEDVKSQARILVEGLPADATWDDLMYRIYVRQAVEAGIADSEADNVIDADEVRRRFGLAQ
jgi:hypothetical protein